MFRGFTQGILGAALRGFGIFLGILWIFVTHGTVTLVFAVGVYIVGSFLGYQSSHTVHIAKD